MNKVTETDQMILDTTNMVTTISPMLPDDSGGHVPCPVLMTEEELIVLLRIPEVSKAKDFHNVVDNLVRIHDLPCIHISWQPLFPLATTLEWIKEKAAKEKSK